MDTATNMQDDWLAKSDHLPSFHPLVLRQADPLIQHKKNRINVHLKLTGLMVRDFYHPLKYKTKLFQGA